MIRLRNTSVMLYDIYEDELHKNEDVNRVFELINRNPTPKMRSINVTDTPLLKYVALMYDKNSPIRKETIGRRKDIAAEQAEFNAPEYERKARCLEGERVIGFVHCYLKYQNDVDWSSYLVNSEVFWRNQEVVLRAGTDAKEQDSIMKLMALSETLKERIKKYQDDIFGDNKEKMHEVIMYYPEDFVAQLKKTGHV